MGGGVGVGGYALLEEGAAELEVVEAPGVHGEAEEGSHGEGGEVQGPVGGVVEGEALGEDAPGEAEQQHRVDAIARGQAGGEEDDDEAAGDDGVAAQAA